MKNQIMSGCVEYVRWSGNYATVLVSQLGDRQLVAPLAFGPRFITAGEETPVFTGLLRNPSISPSDLVVVEVGEINGLQKIVAWGFAQYWTKAEEEISRRPVYRVLRENRFKGQLMASCARGEVVFTGNLRRLVIECPRDGRRVSAVDKLAPSYKTGPVTAIHRFEVKQNGQDWVPCEDPRPFPDGPIYRMMFRSSSGKIRQLSTGTALQIDWEFQRGVSEPLVANEPGGDIYWERFDKGVPMKAFTSEWTECNDPRPFPERETVVAVKQASAKPGVMPKKTARPFSTTLHSLEELTAK